MTTGFSNTAWLFWIGGGVIALAGLTLLFWALWWDRARGRRRCPKGRYDLNGIAAGDDITLPLTCSECGKVVKRKRKLFKTRRHWRWAIFALIGMLAGGWITLMPKADRDGWWSLVPNRALI